MVSGPCEGGCNVAAVAIKEVESLLIIRSSLQAQVVGFFQELAVVSRMSLLVIAALGLADLILCKQAKEIVEVVTPGRFVEANQTPLHQTTQDLMLCITTNELL